MQSLIPTIPRKGYYLYTDNTRGMREGGGFRVIKKTNLNLSILHKEHISAYGEGNERRLTRKQN